MFYKTDCPKHGFYKFETEFQPRCKFCFKLALKRIEELKQAIKEKNQEWINYRYENEKLREIVGKKIVDIVLKEKREK